MRCNTSLLSEDVLHADGERRSIIYDTPRAYNIYAGAQCSGDDGCRRRGVVRVIIIIIITIHIDTPSLYF